MYKEKIKQAIILEFKCQDKWPQPTTMKVFFLYNFNEFQRNFSVYTNTFTTKQPGRKIKILGRPRSILEVKVEHEKCKCR